MVGIVLFALLANVASAAVLRKGLRASSRLESYTFERFLSDFPRHYGAGSKEYEHRLAVFSASLAQVVSVNARNSKEGRLWKAGIHPFMDWTEGEREAMMGYKPNRGQARRSASAVSLLHSSSRAFGRSNMTRLADVDQMTQGGMTAGQGPALRDQGSCGSCWAISAVEAVEAQLIRNGVSEVQLSAQALVDCVPNPQHCGGTGGCDGATGELAYSFMRDYGIPLEGALPYQAETQQCPETPSTGRWAPATQRAVVSGWNQLPSNKARPLKEALVSEGPAVVAVDGKSWFDYEQGIFDGCQKDAILGHAVLAKGFSQEGGHNFWLIQNSWGSQWGENGHIRLLMHDDEDSWCGVDNKPKDGVGCDGGPSEVTVCGACGILFDPLIPQGARLAATAASGTEEPSKPNPSASSDAAGASMDDLLKSMER